MSKALKIMTFNVQQLPWLARTINSLPVVGSPGGSPDADPEVRARAVARAILDLPPREQPDVIAFNEAFSEDARPVLIKELGAKYPNIIKKLEHSGIDVEEDSGLMLFSKLPFLPLASGDDHVFKPYPRAEGSDAKAAKGIAVVRVNGPWEPTTIAFTHLQASYNAANTEHADIRADQLSFLRDVLKDATDGKLQTYADSVIVGDLNIKGDPDDTTGERNLVFSATPNTFGEDFDDGWRVAMHPPGDLKDYDPGYSQRDTPTNQANRFDYVCARRNANVDIGLVPHHMSTPIRLPSEVTDHWALLAHVHRIAPNCMPASAVDLLTIDPFNVNQPESSIWLMHTDLRDEDMHHWVFIREPGTFSVFWGADLEVHAFRRSDFTNELEPADTLSIADLPGPLQSAITQREQRLVGKGKTFAWREPFYLRFRGATPSVAGVLPFVIVRHRGESAETAIVLQPHMTVDAGLPKGQTLGTNDMCFFKAARPDNFAETAYDDRFELRNSNSVKAKLEMLDEAKGTLGLQVTGTDPVMVLTRNHERETVFLVLRRGDVNDVHFGVFWDSPLTFVRLDESFRFHVDDESGPDWPGEDEYSLRIDVDSENVYSDTWDDADTGEDWPGLVAAVSASVLAKSKRSGWAAFAGEISYDLLKTDGIGASGSRAGIIRALDASDGDEEERTASIDVPGTVSDGSVTVRAMLSKYPPV